MDYSLENFSIILEGGKEGLSANDTFEKYETDYFMPKMKACTDSVSGTSVEAIKEALTLLISES
ncbi:hypothetical protein DID80_02785 [Candidatus Marinamargulisbacteria bacterium SCGC AAA071-K20]|nr:hypothetical protein DID80_02785 [Candidatus Marinamargulisbacteria bacterium SCGC AAA071-K20]